MKHLGKETRTEDILTNIEVGSQDIVTLTSGALQGADGTEYIAIAWDQEIHKDASFSHSIATENTKIFVSESGSYDIKSAINYNGTTGNYRFTSEVRIRLNGVTLLSPVFTGSYIRANSGSNDSTVNANTTLKLSAGDYIEILTKRISTTTGDAVVSAGTNISLVKLSGVKGESASFTTGTGGPNDNDGEPNGNVYYQTL